MCLTRVVTVVVMIFGLSPATAGQQPPQQELLDRLLKAEADEVAPGEDPEEAAKILYSLGFNLWAPLVQLGLTPTEADSVLSGLRDAAGGGDPNVSIETYGPMIEAFARTRIIAGVAEEKARAQAYMASTAAEPGAVRSASGLVFFDLRPGTGAMPTSLNTVRVNYRGTLSDGTEFDSSYGRGELAEFALGSVIACWTEGVAKMRVGGQARLVCPAAIGYGDRGQPPDIPGGAALNFEIELLGIVR